MQKAAQKNRAKTIWRGARHKLAAKKEIFPVFIKAMADKPWRTSLYEKVFLTALFDRFARLQMLGMQRAGGI